jgi:DNA-binding beta-propeller fold protein YncE
MDKKPINDPIKKKPIDYSAAKIRSTNSKPSVTGPEKGKIIPLKPDINETTIKKPVRKTGLNTNNNVLYSILAVALIIILFILFHKGSGQLSGVVVDASSNNPLTNPQIIMDEKENFEGNSIGGGFLIQNIKAGEHTFTFKVKGYQEETVKIIIKSGDNIEQKISLNSVTTTETFNLAAFDFFVANSGSDNITAISLKNPNLSKIIQTGKNPADILVSAASKRLYTANPGDNSVSVVSLENFKEIKRYQMEMFSEPAKLAFSQAKDKLYLLNKTKPYISSINLNSGNQVNSAIQLPQPARDMEVDPASGNLIIYDNNGISIYSDSGNLINSFPVNGASGNKIFFSKQKNAVFLAGVGNIIQLSISSGETRLIPVKVNADEFVLRNDNLYLASANSISVIDSGSGNTKKENIQNGGQGISQLKLSNDGSKIYIVNSNSNNISIFDCNKEEMLPDLIMAGSNPKGIGVF